MVFLLDLVASQRRECRCVIFIAFRPWFCLHALSISFIRCRWVDQRKFCVGRWHLREMPNISTSKLIDKTLANRLCLPHLDAFVARRCARCFIVAISKVARFFSAFRWLFFKMTDKVRRLSASNPFREHCIKVAELFVWRAVSPFRWQNRKSSQFFPLNVQINMSFSAQTIWSFRFWVSRRSNGSANRIGMYRLRRAECHNLC